ncbi:hypothetical protein AB4Y63_02965 [Leifsonia sp. YAF41]|uniref:hypothetical protein n=1 Tax=Leifsonia sp. YAF41 TaxID=3233086 RepID=UPI003F988D94
MSQTGQSEFPQPPYPAQPPAQFGSQPPHPAAKPPVGGLAIAALVVGGTAFLLGWLVGLGLLLGLAGIVLGILAIRTKTGRTFGVIGLVLSAIATMTNIVAILVFGFFVSGSASQIAAGLNAGLDRGAVALGTQTVETPCYSFEVPASYLNNLPETDVAACASRLEVWGELTPDGEVLSTGTGAIFGTIEVEPLRIETSDAMAPDDTVEGMVQELSLDYLPSMGVVESLLEPIMLDGVPANLTRIDSDTEFTDLEAVITARAPDVYQSANGPVQYFVVTVVLPDEAGETVDDDLILAQLISSWTWN